MNNRLLVSVAPVVLAVLTVVLLSWGAAQPAPSPAHPGASGPTLASPTGEQHSPTWLPAPRRTDTATASSPSRTEAPSAGDPIALGYFIPGAASDPDEIDKFTQMVGTAPRIVMWYQNWADEWSAFSPKTADAIRSRGATPMISWEPMADAVEDRRWSLRSILNGSHNAYIRRWVRDVAAWGHRLYVRPMYEMNGWWTSWGADVNGNSPAEFVEAWRHIVDLARAAGATNIRWIWSPNVDLDGLGTPLPEVFPGDSHVDWVGLDGFNRGTSWDSTRWQGVVEIFGPSIADVRELTQKPLMIGETASSEVGGDKAEWIRTSLGSVPTDLPEVRAVVWFSKNETSVGIDWRVNSSAASLEAFRELAGSSAFSGSLP